MLRKSFLGIAVALVSFSLLVFSVMNVMAQSDDEATPVVAVAPNMAAASVVQTVPVTLTLTIPGPNGPVTVEVLVYIALDIRIGISPDLTTTFAVTPSVVTPSVVTELATVAPTPTSAVDTESEAEATVAAPTSTPTSLPTPVPATPTVAAVDETTDEVAEAPVAEPTVVPLPTATPIATAETEAAAPLCPDPRAVIVAPGAGQSVSGSVNIIGTATHENFQYYKVEYAIGGDVDPNATFSYLADARVQVTGGLLAAFDSTTFDNGVYTFKLTVVDNSGNFPPPCTVTMIIANE